MNLIPGGLAEIAQDARARLAILARSAAARGTQPESALNSSAMAAAARAAIFTDALLAAMHARLEELKTVAR